MRRALPLLLPVALIACSPATPPADSAATPAAAPADLPDAATADHAATLGAYHWRLVDARDGAGAPIDGLLAEGGAPLQLDFRDGGVSVSNACNRINASVTLDDDRLEVGPAVSTQMACLDERLAGLEREIGARLPGTHRLAVTAGDTPRLSLQTDAGDVLQFDGAPTPGTRYGSAGERMFLEVAPERVPCNHPLIPDHRCLQVRPVRYDEAGVRAPGEPDWAPLYQEIEGFEHEDSMRNVLRVQRFDVADPPADAPSQAYVLDTVVESESMRR